jgi:hypothetical protein
MRARPFLSGITATPFISFPGNCWRKIC